MKAVYRQRKDQSFSKNTGDQRLLSNEDSLKIHLRDFISITDAEMSRVMSFFSELIINKNEYLVKEGTKVHNTYWVKKGLLVSCFNNEEGKEHIIQFASENCWVTDQDAFYNQKLSTLNIIALEKSELLCLSFENRETLCSEMHLMEQFFRKKANDSFVKQQKRLITYLTSNAKERYDLLLDEYPYLLQRLSKKLLAAYLGVSRETLSRL